MKWVRFGAPGQERPGVVDAHGLVRDLSGVIDDLGGSGLEQQMEKLRTIAPESLPVVPAGVRLGPPVAGIGKIVAVGLNYADHARESRMTLPSEPVLFMKAVSAVCGPTDAVLIPPGAAKLDWEVELGVVIGRTARRVSAGAAMAHVAGYCCAIDFSERHWQLERGGQWDKGKGFDTFAPLGPWLVYTDEVPDAQTLRLWLDVEGARMQDGTTADMLFGVQTLVSYISQCMTLLPGDVILTGTPPGVGMGRTPPRYLTAGETVSCGIDGLGEQRHRVETVAE